jgi:hypothetical protein
MNVEDVEEGEVWKGYIHECIRQRVGEGHRENGLQLEEQVEFPKRSRVFNENTVVLRFDHGNCLAVVYCVFAGAVALETKRSE